MNNKTIISVVITVFVLAGIVWLAKPDSEGNDADGEASSSPSTLVAEENQYDFGAISMAAGDVSHSFKVTNGGTEPVVIEKMYTSCMCTTAALEMNGQTFGPYGMPGHGAIPRINKAIPAGGEAEVEVVFDPAAHGPAGVGPISRLVIIETDSNNPLELKISAQVVP